MKQTFKNVVAATALTVAGMSVAKTNARASITDPETNLRLYAFGSNLNNAVSHMQKFRQDFGVGESYARPRMYGIGLEYKY